MTRALLFSIVLLTAACQHHDVSTAATADSEQLLTRAQIEQRAQDSFNQLEGVDPSYAPRFSEHDLDHDGVAELFVALPWTGGNSGMDHQIYQRAGDSYRPLGTLWFHPAAFRVLPPTPDHPIRITRYLKSSGSEGQLEILTYQNGQFITLSSETIHPGDGGTNQGRQRYAEVFSE